MRSVGVVTVGRSDYGLLRPVLQKLEADPEIELMLLVGGMHLLPRFGRTVEMIESDGFPIAARVDNRLQGDDPQAIARSMGHAVIGYADVFSRRTPDLLLLLGDRFEMHAAAVAALPFKIPLAHIHGGELTQGAFDDALRHSITKLSHLHFVSTEEYARRVIQMGEEPWRVTVSGAPGLDSITAGERIAPEELSRRFGFPLQPAPLLVTFHPVTLEYERTAWQIGQLLEALGKLGLPTVFTLPNADTGNVIVADAVRRFVKANPLATLVENLGTPAYTTLMSSAAAMVGNSSSGIIEAASLKLPVVNVGTRQKGRVRAGNVIDVGYEAEAIVSGIRKAKSPEFRAGLTDLRNPYGDGHASDVIVAKLKAITLGDELVTKVFCDRWTPGNG